MKPDVLYKKRLEHKLKVFNKRLSKFGYPALSEVIEQLESLFENQLDFLFRRR